MVTKLRIRRAARLVAVDRLLLLQLLVLILFGAQGCGSPAPNDSARPGPAATASPVAQADEDDDTYDGPPQSWKVPGAPPTPTAVPRPQAGGLRTELVADKLILPANLTFAPDGRLFLTEVSAGRVRVIANGQLQAGTVLEVDAAVRGEQGLLGLVLDPRFGETPYLYVYYSQQDGGRPWRNRLIRYRLNGNQAASPVAILDDLPIGDERNNGGHNGGRLAFGPDGKLYVTIGDVGAGGSAQALNKLTGKLLRINPDGSIPGDNPFPGSPVYALGLRNAYGLAFHPLTGVPYVSENGHFGHDEIDRIQAGGNYGAPRVEGIAGDPRFVDPIWENYQEGGGVSGLAFYDGALFPQFKHDLLFCTWSHGLLLRLKLGGPNLDRVMSEDQLSNQCRLDVTTGPDGAIYFSTYDKVYRLVPER